MDQTRFYPGTFDLNPLAGQLVMQFQMRGYQTQSFGVGSQVVVQIRKGGEAAKLFGAQAALTTILTQHPEGLLATLGQKKWGDKAVAAGVGALILWPLAITAAVGAVRQSNLPNDVLMMLDMLVLQQNSLAYPAAPPPHLMAQAMGMYQPAPPPAPAPAPAQPQQIFCPACHRPNNVGATFCQHCAAPLAAPVAPPPPPPGTHYDPPPPPPPSGAQYEPTMRAAPSLEPTERADSPSATAIGILTLPSGRTAALTNREAIIGRGPASGPDAVAVDLSDEPERTTVSRRHAKIVRAGAGFALEDLNSANLTRLNGEQVAPGRPAPLKSGDVIEFGKVRCVFRVQ